MGSMLNRLKDTLRTIEGLNDIISPEDKEDIQKRLIHGLKALTIIPVGKMSTEEIEDLKTISIINSLLCERRFNIQIRRFDTGTLIAEKRIKIEGIDGRFKSFESYDNMMFSKIEKERGGDV